MMTVVPAGRQSDLFATVSIIPTENLDLEMARAYSEWRRGILTQKLSIERYEDIFLETCAGMREGKRPPLTCDRKDDNASWFAPGDAEAYMNAEPYLHLRGDAAALRELAFNFACGVICELKGIGELEKAMRSHTGHRDPCGLSYEFSPGKIHIKDFSIGPAEIELGFTFNAKDLYRSLKLNDVR